MITELKQIPEFLGIVTNVDASQVPMGGALTSKNLAQLKIGRVQRIPGVSEISAPAIDASSRIPLVFWATGIGAGGADQLIAVFVGASAVSIVNLSTGLAMTGPALAAPNFTAPWTATFYANKWIIGGGNNTSIYQLDSASAYSAVTGTPSPPGGNLVQSFLDRLYVADLTGVADSEGLVQYSNVLTFDFAGTNLVNTKELPGKITALAINAPATDTTGIQTQLVIAKHTSLTVWDETSKDVVSQVVGISSAHAWASTEAGLLFLGHKGTKHSVHLLPLGTIGEPADVGDRLTGFLNEDLTISDDNEHLAFAVAHGRFFKMFYSANASNTNQVEFWLDTFALLTERKVLWYGPHDRGGFDAGTIGSPASGNEEALTLVKRGSAGAAKRFEENADTSCCFNDSAGATMVAELDLPTNVEPYNAEKQFDVAELQIAKEANVSGNQITVEPIGEGTSKGTFNKTIYNNKPNGIARVVIPYHAQGTTGMTARDARLKITQSLNQRLDILGVSIQYLYHEGRDRVRSQS